MDLSPVSICDSPPHRRFKLDGAYDLQALTAKRREALLLQKQFENCERQPKQGEKKCLRMFCEDLTSRIQHLKANGASFW